MRLTGELREWLPWVIKIRFVIITFVFAIEYTLRQIVPTSTSQDTIPHLGIAIVIWYVLGLFYLIYNQLSEDYLLQAYLQIFLDIILITSIIHFTGDLDSNYYSLYPVAILMWSTLLHRAGALLVASICFIAMGLLLELAYLPRLYPILGERYAALQIFETHSTSDVDLTTLQVKIFFSFFGFFGVAYLGSYLAEMLRKRGDELKDQRGQVANLQALNLNIIDSMREGLITTDLEGRIAQANPAGQTILETESLGGKPLSEVLPGIDPHLPFREPGRRQEIFYYAPERGERKILEVSVSLLTTPEKGAVGYVYNFADFTDEKKREIEYRAKDRMASLGRLSAGIAHEIRNPLASIVGSVKLFRDQTGMDEDHLKLIDIVTQESERLNKIVSDFLVYARGHRYQFAKANVVEILEETLLLLEHHPTFDTRHKIERQFSSERVEAWVDSDQIRQVFWNICTNSIKAMPDGGVLTVAVQPQDEDTVCVSIEDTGVGFSESQLEKLFEPFQSSFPDGTGLGLAIAQQVVEAHQGKIRAESEPNRGARFLIEIPRHARVRSKSLQEI